MRVAILGVGLIGGSVGLAARARLDAHVRGYDPDGRTLDEAERLGAIDARADDVAAAVRDAEAVFVAAPVGRLEEAVRAALDAAPRDCVVTDVGSTKRAIVAAVHDERFVGGHPLAGAETAGVEHARENLFEDATWYLTPAPGTSGILYERLHRALTRLGAQPVAIEPELHDRVMATVSHLPHVLANVLAAQASNVIGSEERVPASGPSLRDAIRVAGANSAIWTDIYLSNREALVATIDDTVAALRAVAETLTAGERDAVTGWNDAARRDRDRLLGAGMGDGPLSELRVSVPNRPGVIAEIALALGRAGVNIVDMALSPSPDYRRGVITMWVRGEEQAGRAAGLIAELDFDVARI